MDRHALAAGHIANDLFAVKRVTATRARHHQIVDAAHHDRIVAQTNEPFDSADTAPQPRLLLLVELFEMLCAKRNGPLDSAPPPPHPRLLLLVELFNRLWSKILRDDFAWNQSSSNSST